MGSKPVRFSRNAIPRKMMAKKPVSLSDIRAARRRIRSGVIVTPCRESIPLSEITGARIVCKLDNFQRTGSFKERGARNALLRLPKANRVKGVVAASAGNHALGLAYHGRLLGIPVTVVMPEFAPLIKITTCQRLGRPRGPPRKRFLGGARRGAAVRVEGGARPTSTALTIRTSSRARGRSAWRSSSRFPTSTRSSVPLGAADSSPASALRSSRLGRG